MKAKPLIVACAAAMLFAGAIADGAILPDGRLKLVVQADGQAFLVNTTTTSVRISAYEIRSTAGLLNPSPRLRRWDPELFEEVYTSLFSPETAWTSIQDRAATGNMAPLTSAAPAGCGIGSSAVGFVELSNITSCLTEASGIDGHIIVRPAGTAAPIPLGKITNTPRAGDLSIVYSIPSAYGGTPGNIYRGQVELTPEPATLALLAVGGLTVRRKRRN